MAATSSSQEPKVARRPQLGPSARSTSYLLEHQQYRPPTQPETHFGIDTVVEDLGSTSLGAPRVISLFSGVPDKENPPTIIESGVTHDLSHPNCCPSPGSGAKTSRLIATLMYKARSPRISNAVPSPRLAPQKDSTLSSASTATSTTAAEPPSETSFNLGPTSDPAVFPMELPTEDVAEPPLDHLYGSYVSQFCVASFLHLMSNLPHLGPGDLRSSHRCLDSTTHPLVVELTLDPAPDPAHLTLNDLRRHESIYRFEREWNVDVVLQRDELWRRYPRLVVFDMDSTLIMQEVIDLLAAQVPVDAGGDAIAPRVADITHRAMLGELEFAQAFRQRLALLKGLPVTVFERLRPVLRVTEGVRPLLRALRRLGVKTAVLSGGFQPLTSWLAQELGIDYAYANEVEVDENGLLTGEALGLIVGKERKRDLLVEIAEKEKIDRRQVVCIGDGANDLLMMEAAGLGVAWNAKPVVQMEADARLNGSTMLDLLYLFGFTREEIEELTAE